MIVRGGICSGSLGAPFMVCICANYYFYGDFLFFCVFCIQIQAIREKQRWSDPLTQSHGPEMFRWPVRRR
jgi:hypothetical protein